MTDVFDAATRSQIMAKVRSHGTTPERAVSGALRSAGWRLSQPGKGLPGKPDFTIPSLRLAIFVNGCFWHWHGCPRCRMPRSNTDYWERKIARNVQRDRRVRRKLNAAGWHYCTLWECRLDEGIARLLTRLRTLSVS